MESNIKSLQPSLKKRCGLCNVITSYKNCSWHLRVTKHPRNDQDQTNKPRFHRKTKKKKRTESLLPIIRIERIQNPYKNFCQFSNKLINKNPPKVTSSRRRYFENKIPTHKVF